MSDPPPYDDARRGSMVDLLEAGLAELDLSCAAEVVGTLADLAGLLEWWGARINLTGHRSAEAIVRRLILDAAALVAQLPEVHSLNDLGSGAGFPGIPIAILRPDTEVLLVEARERRQHFQRVAVRELRLARVSTLRGRMEEVSPRPADAVVAQAVAPPDQVVEWMIGWASHDGLMAIPGGVEPPRVSPRPDVADARVVRYRVPLGGPERTLWIGRRCSPDLRSDQD